MSLSQQQSQTLTLKNENNNNKIFTCRECASSSSSSPPPTFTSRNQLFLHLESVHGLVRDEDDAIARTACSEEIRSRYYNPHHDAYYQCQIPHIMTREEWNTALEYLRKPLPITFRINQKITPEDIRHNFLIFDKEEGQTNNDDTNHDIMSLFFKKSPIVPHAWVARRPPREYTQFLQRQLADAQDVGAMNRQELCSMTPVLLLLHAAGNNNTTDDGGEQQQQPLLKGNIMDLCAAPGSKTLQLLDCMDTSCPESSSMLVANDADRQRLLTVARRSRLVPRSSLILNSSDGRYFPSLRRRWRGYKVKFDHVLCDVPCSGDGTLRKCTIKEWNQWNTRRHLQLHKLQVRLLQRSLDLVRKGGRVVYSTCSLDPIENEAVVASVLRGREEEYRLVPAPKYFGMDPPPSAVMEDSDDGRTIQQRQQQEPFSYTPGARTWVVPHPNFTAQEPIVYQQFEEVPSPLHKTIIPSMFSSPNDDALGLQHCCRILPQHLDSGGFFCAMIERIHPLYYPVCCPSNSNNNEHHGRIYHPVESARQLRKAIMNDDDDDVDRNNDDNNKNNALYYFEGVATLELAQDWLRQHFAFVPHKSQTTSVLPQPPTDKTTTMTTNDGNEGEAKKASSSSSKQSYDNGTQKTPTFTSLLVPPHPDLVQEFLNFYGLGHHHDDHPTTVKLFPIDHMVIPTGSTVEMEDRNMNITTCINVWKYQRQQQSPSLPNSTTKKKKQKFIPILLCSPEIRNLGKGGAKFTPMELGQALCYIPVPPLKEEEEATHYHYHRAFELGKFGLLDEAVMIVGPCATKRIVWWDDVQEVLNFLQQRTKENVILDEVSGGIIVAHRYRNSVLYLSCRFDAATDSDADPHGGTVTLLTESRLANCWKRLLMKRTE